MADRPEVFVVIPNWNGKHLIEDCLNSLLDQSYEPFQIMVVDNGSTDGSKELIQMKYSKVELAALVKNCGFAGGVNRGIKKAIEQGAKYIALLNNDAVADRDWLKNLVKTADQYPWAGIITSKLLRADGKTIDSTGDFLSIWILPFPRGRDEVDEGQFDDASEQEVFSGSGGASLFKVEMLKEIGLFDEDFFAYYEDIDMGFRAQLAGWKVRYEPSAVVYHKMSDTSSRVSAHFGRYHSLKNMVYLHIKNMPSWLFFKYLPQFLLGFFLLIAHDFLDSNSLRE